MQKSQLLNIKGENIETDHIQAQIARLNSIVFRCSIGESAQNKVQTLQYFLIDQISEIDDEMFRLSVDVLGSEQAASFAIKEILPVLSSGEIEEASEIIIENFNSKLLDLHKVLVLF